MGLEFHHKPNGNHVKWPSPLFFLPTLIRTALFHPSDNALQSLAVFIRAEASVATVTYLVGDLQLMFVSFEIH